MTSKKGQLKALIYVRKSSADKRSLDGRSRSTGEQEAESRAWCKREGWNVIGVEIDDGISASRHSARRRPGWDAVKARIASGEVDVLVTWEASRASRDLAAYASLRNLCAEHDVLWAYSGQLYDLSLGSDRFRTGIDALIGESESDKTQERVLRAIRANAVAGKPHGRIVYGYRRDYDPETRELIAQRPHPTEAPIVVEIITRVANGESMRGLAHELNERGLTTSTGAPWSATTIRRTARNLTYAGVRVHRAAKKNGGHVDISDGTWEPLVTRELVEAAIDRTDGNEMTRRMPSSTPVHLLSGLLRCGRCGGKMFRGHDRNGVHTYVCRTRQFVDPATGRVLGLGHTTVRKERVDLIVEGLISAWLQRPDNVALVAAANESTTEYSAAAELRQQLDDAVEQFTRMQLSASLLAKVEQRLLPMIEHAERAARRRSVSPVVADALEGGWLSLGDDMSRKREVIAALVEITVMPPSKPSAKFEPSRLAERWLF